MADIRAWLAARGLHPFPFQEACWQAWQAGQSGLVQVPTGSGKTWAATLAPLAEIAPRWRHPLTSRTAAGMLRRLDPSGQGGLL